MSPYIARSFNQAQSELEGKKEIISKVERLLKRDEYVLAL